MKTSGPVDGNVALLSVESGSSLHTSTGADATELEEPIKHRAIIADVVFALFTHVAVHVVRGDFLKEIDVVVRVELCHFAAGGWFRTLVCQVSTLGHVGLDSSGRSSRKFPSSGTSCTA